MYSQLYTYDRKDVGVEMGRKVFGTGKKKIPGELSEFFAAHQRLWEKDLFPCQLED